MEKVTSQLITSTYAEHKELIDKCAAIASRKHKTLFTQDDLENCKLHAVYKTLANFDISKNTQFTTYLCNNIRWEIAAFVKNEIKYYKKHKAVQVSVSYNEDFNSQDIISDITDIDIKELVIDKLVKGMTFREIAKTRNICKETARKKFVAFLEDFKQNSV